MVGLPLSKWPLTALINYEADALFTYHALALKELAAQENNKYPGQGGAELKECGSITFKITLEVEMARTTPNAGLQ